MTETISPVFLDALIIIDVQNDFCPSGALEVPDGDAVIPVINEIAPKFKTVVCTQDWHPANHVSFASNHKGKKPYDKVQTQVQNDLQVLWPDHCIQDTPGAAFHKSLDVPNCQLVLRKGHQPNLDSYSAFYDNDRWTPTALTDYLRRHGIYRVFLTGLALDVCVRYSALDARKDGFETYVIEDACRGLDKDGSLDEVKKAMTAAGAQLITSADIGEPYGRVRVA